MNRDAAAARLRAHATAAAQSCPSHNRKTSQPTPLRHTAAMLSSP